MIFRRKKLKKAQTVEHNALITLVFASAVILLFIIAGGLFASYLKSKWEDNTCRTTVIANSEVRGNTVSKFFSDDEKIAAQCPRDEDETISYSQVKGRSDASAVVGYNIMQNIAEKMSNCHYRYAGDINITPFANSEGVYCGICNKVAFDEKIKEVDFGAIDNSGEVKRGVIVDFYSYLINSKDPGSKQYYSEYLFGYKKAKNTKTSLSDEFSNVNLNNDFTQAAKSKVGNFNVKTLDIDIDTSKEYFVTHLVFKSKNGYDKYFDELGKDSKLKTIGCGIAAVGLVGLSPFTGFTSLAIGAGVMTACYGGTTAFAFANSDVPTIRTTTIIPVEDISKCTMVYGLKTREEV